VPDATHETWRPILGYEGQYEVSDFGRVRGLSRRVRDGRRIEGRILKLDHSDKRGYLRAGLVSMDGRQRKRLVHRLVLEAFAGPAPANSPHCRHLNGDPSDCHLGNLKWGTVSENAHDRVRHGTWVNNNRFVNATHCIHGHEFTEANTYWRPTGGRTCRTCHAQRARERRSAA